MNTRDIILAAAAIAMLLSFNGSATAAPALDTVLTPEFARMTGEINAAVERCGFKLRQSERVFTRIPEIYLDRRRDDLLNQTATASQAFQERYERDPIDACDQARSRHGVFD
jgi:hypothetical protein